MILENDEKQQIVPFEFKEINSIQLTQKCSEIAINPSQSILAIALERGFSKFYFFKSGEPKLIGNFNKVDNLMWIHFFFHSTLYSSLNSRSQYIIWNANCLNNKKFIQQIKFQQQINAIIINHFEDLMLVGMDQGILKSLQKDVFQWNEIQEIKISYSINSLSLNHKENQLIASVSHIKIVILEKKSSDLMWTVLQEIQMYNSFRKTIFISDNTFSIKLFNVRKWLLFKQQQNNLFHYKKDISIFGSNQDLQQILKKYQRKVKNKLDESNSFLNLEFQLDKQYLGIKDNKQFQDCYFNRNFGDTKRIGEYCFSEDFQNKKIIIAKYQQLYINYKLFNEIKFPKQENYQAIAVNSDQKIIVVGFNQQIKIFQLEESRLNLLQILDNQKGRVNCLVFLSNTNSFISGSEEKYIQIWTWDYMGKLYQIQQNLIGLVEQKYILTNKKEDLLVSGGYNLIQFWISNQSYWQLQQNLHFGSNFIYGLNLSPSQQIIATYLSNKKIIVIKSKKVNQQVKWLVTLEISVQDFTPSISFISDQKILFQSINEKYLKLIILNQDCDQILNQSEIFINQVCSYNTTLQMQFNQKKKVLVNQTQSFLNIILIFEGDQILLHKQIQLKNSNIYMLLSIDGNFLNIYDNETSKLEIRQYYSN